MNDIDNDNDKGTGTGGVESPLLNNFVYGVVDYKGRPVPRSKSCCWRSAYFIIGVEVAERIAYYGVSSNLITYLTGPLGQSTATAAENVNVWAGTASLLPLVGAFIADAFLGRYLTVILASLLYILAFGADQFDADDPDELKSKSSFFNWWYFGLSGGPTVGIFVLSYIQDNLSWGLGFGIPCVIMGFALIMFLFGTVTYRFGEKTQEKNAFARATCFLLQLGMESYVFRNIRRRGSFWDNAPSRFSTIQLSQQSFALP